MVFGVIMTEPLTYLKVIYLYPKGKRDPFHMFGANPLSLSAKQLEERPVLLIHGKAHNQSAWIPLLKFLSHQTSRPMFTLNLQYDGDHLVAKEKIISKIEEIKRLYASYGKHNIVVDLIGHSRGCLAISLAAMDSEAWCLEKGGRVRFKMKPKWRDDFGIFIRMGNPASYWERGWMPADILERCYEIDAIKDVLSADFSQAKGKHRIRINTGHLGLLFSKESHQAILNILNKAHALATLEKMKILANRT